MQRTSISTIMVMMMRRHTTEISLILIGLLIISSLVGCKDRKAPPDEHYNLLFIGVDTLRTDALGCYGGIDRYGIFTDWLSRRSLQFTNAYSQIPITAPSFSTMMTAKYPTEHGVINNNYKLSDKHETLAEILKNNGFRTGAVISGHVLDAKYGLSQGFDYYDNEFFLTQHASTTTKKGIDWLTSDPEWTRKPFFLWLHYIDPHSPYEAEDKELLKLYFDHKNPTITGVSTDELNRIYRDQVALDAESIRRYRNFYYQQCVSLEKALLPLKRLLAKHDLFRRTLIVFVSDHGETLYEHKNYFGHAFSVYDECIRVPLVLSMPQRLPLGYLYTGDFALKDLSPLIIELLEIKHQWRLIGKPLLQGILTQRDNMPIRSACLFQTFAPEGERDVNGIIANDIKIFKIPSTNQLEIFNLGSDPAEQHPSCEPSTKAEKELIKLLDALVSDLPSRESIAVPILDKERLEMLKTMGYIH